MTFRLRKGVSVLFVTAVLTLTGVVAASAGTLLGDADSDGEVAVVDATCVQRHLAEMPLNGCFAAAAADVDGSGEIEITDATFIQRWVAEIQTPYPIGKDPDAPTVPPTQRPTDADGWGREIYQP